MNDHWYKRTEFWTTVVTALGGCLAAAHSSNPIVQNISATIAGAAPLVYSWGRSQIKIAKVTPPTVTPVIATAGVEE